MVVPSARRSRTLSLQTAVRIVSTGPMAPQHQNQPARSTREHPEARCHRSLGRASLMGNHRLPDAAGRRNLCQTTTTAPTGHTVTITNMVSDACATSPPPSVGPTPPRQNNQTNCKGSMRSPITELCSWLETFMSLPVPARTLSKGQTRSKLLPIIVSR